MTKARQERMEQAVIRCQNRLIRSAPEHGYSSLMTYRAIKDGYLIVIPAIMDWMDESMGDGGVTWSWVDGWGWENMYQSVKLKEKKEYLGFCVKHITLN